MASLMFSKITWHVEASGHLDYIGHAVWRHFVVLLCIILPFETKSPFTSMVLATTTMPVSCETPAVFCGLKIFPRPSIGIGVSR